MALPAKVPDPPIGSTTTLGQANITTPQPSTTTSTTTNTRSYLDVATATPAPGQVPVVLFSNLPTSTDRVWRKSTSCHSVFFTPPTDSTLTSEFWTALRASVPMACTLGISFTHRQLLIHELHLTNSTICTKLCSKGFLVGGQTYFPSMGIAPGTKILRISLSQLPYLPSPMLEEAIKTALAAYGTIREVGLHLRDNFFDGTGTWKQMGIHCNYCKVMGHAIENCPDRPKDSRCCFTCDQTSHLQHACPRAPPTDASSSKRPRKVPTTHDSPDCSRKTTPGASHRPPAKKSIPPRGTPMMAEGSQATTTTSRTDSSTPRRPSVPTVPTSPRQSANRFAALDGLTDNSRTGALFDPTLPLPQTHNTQYDPVFHPLHNAFLPSNYTSGSTKDEEEFHPSTFDGDNDQDSQNILTDDEMVDGDHS
ncbi:hypothetical protein PHYBLDRAFT_173955 [Phycomyces blakesleeanus NRRL 1555(-)]|uniref:CCHC-type zinc finger transcription factor n=1 Tax=Phycomyces blakesleeanus (strain ATCC 8743b / DSM 1359 / FGSC 10004 / NBRC 33097 / NRRL 1555) TaxID=763407 RepID=A0A162TJG5_PHYB8|nr:hypothetical protein PHYBLDRAFT_173955 [Phycomyces blakesleeanus NRRL 1555(-)]OAD67623.1 hypothetical protein PHYBLDRAFT_173955 [Phycomyces blakesleeanus NRRL 1555(-)]|eukprot:XP_018285663.1 hypothetical protein PHYBLDRAFT_173955 [Phycomyces blakesleeanus NRRL 1555(-)]